jgi:hypothetical protein
LDRGFLAPLSLISQNCTVRGASLPQHPEELLEGRWTNSIKVVAAANRALRSLIAKVNQCLLKRFQPPYRQTVTARIENSPPPSPVLHHDRHHVRKVEGISHLPERPGIAPSLLGRAPRSAEGGRSVIIYQLRAFSMFRLRQTWVAQLLHGFRGMAEPAHL